MMNLEEFYIFIKNEVGIDLFLYKQKQLQRRILSFLERKGFKDFEEYARSMKNNEKEISEFIDYITINVTDFFRNYEMFKIFEEIVVKLFRKYKKIKIWSAGCSIGAEPYTVAMIFNSVLPYVDISVYGTDINPKCIAKSEKSIYSKYEIKLLPNKYLNRYVYLEEENYKISEEIRKKCFFMTQNILKDRYLTDCDIILCRNVVIYFNDAVKEEVFKKLSKSLNNGGIIFVGSTESIVHYKKYGLVKLSAFIYQKVVEENLHEYKPVPETFY